MTTVVFHQRRCRRCGHTECPCGGPHGCDILECVCHLEHDDACDYGGAEFDEEGSRRLEEAEESFYRDKGHYPLLQSSEDGMGVVFAEDEEMGVFQ